MMCLPKQEINAKETFCLKTAVFLCYCSRLSNNVVVIIANLNMPNMQSY